MPMLPPSESVAGNIGVCGRRSDSPMRSHQGVANKLPSPFLGEGLGLRAGLHKTITNTLTKY